MSEVVSTPILIPRLVPLLHQTTTNLHYIKTAHTTHDKTTITPVTRRRKNRLSSTDFSPCKHWKGLAGCMVILNGRMWDWRVNKPRGSPKCIRSKKANTDPCRGSWMRVCGQWSSCITDSFICPPSCGPPRLTCVCEIKFLCSRRSPFRVRLSRNGKWSWIRKFHSCRHKRGDVLCTYVHLVFMLPRAPRPFLVGYGAHPPWERFICHDSCLFGSGTLDKTSSPGFLAYLTWLPSRTVAPLETSSEYVGDELILWGPRIVCYCLSRLNVIVIVDCRAHILFAIEFPLHTSRVNHLKRLPLSLHYCRDASWGNQSLVYAYGNGRRRLQIYTRDRSLCHNPTTACRHIFPQVWRDRRRPSHLFLNAMQEFHGGIPLAVCPFYFAPETDLCLVADLPQRSIIRDREWFPLGGAAAASAREINVTRCPFAF